jgi:hypothetical protein
MRLEALSGGQRDGRRREGWKEVRDGWRLQRIEGDQRDKGRSEMDGRRSERMEGVQRRCKYLGWNREDYES